jgi:YHS domain-containing protein
MTRRTNTRHMWVALALAVGFTPNLAWAQHEEHQAAGAQAASSELTQCLRVQPAIQNIIAGAMARAEAARLSNSPADLRAALDQLEAALRDIRSQSAPCAAAAASADPHAGHAMPTAQPAPATAPAQAPAADPHAGHMMMHQPAKQKDPVSGVMVDPATAPNTTYQGQTYYFSSEQSKKEFLANPAKFAKPKG